MAEQQKFTINVDDRYSDSELQAIGQDVIDHIVERTRSRNLDKNNETLGRYSDSYADSLEFQIAGKSKGSVDLTLTGEMLDSLQILRTRRGVIEIGYPAGSSLNDKVEGNRLGSYGKSPNRAKARDFLGIHESNLNSILADYPVDESQDERIAVEQSTLRRIIERIGLAETIELD